MPISGLKSVSHEVTVETSLRDNSVEVAVMDTGPGFESGIEPFKAFETSKKNGLGIGLSISKSFVQSHHGELFLDEFFERGSRVLFTLPIESAPAKMN